IIPAIAVPVSIIGTFGIMYLFGYSLDNLSLMGLSIAVGFVVDDAIVMVENIVRHLEMGKTPMQAALDGAGEVGFTIVGGFKRSSQHDLCRLIGETGQAPLRVSSNQASFGAAS